MVNSTPKIPTLAGFAGVTIVCTAERASIELRRRS